MNTFQKTIKILAICLAIIIIVTIFSLLFYGIETISGINLNIKDKETTFQKTYSNIERIELEAKTANIIISSGNKLKIKTKNIDSNFKELEHNNKLKIEETNPIFNKQSKEKIIIIEIPKNNTIKEFSVETGTGKIEITDISIQKLGLDQGTGILNINNSTFEETEIDGGAGKISIDSSILNNLELNAGLGKIEIEAKITGNSQLECGMGEIDITLLGNKNDYSITPEKGIGTITINNESIKNNKTYGNGENKLKIEGGIGIIDIDFYE